jgi:hypothetical protein
MGDTNPKKKPKPKSGKSPVDKKTKSDKSKS